VSTPALKEWAAAVHALLDGRQTVLLRKGGIHEKRFSLAAGEFLLFPTVAHSHTQRVRPEHRGLLEYAPDSTEDTVVLRAGAKVVAAIEVNRPEAIGDIADLHIWTEESVREYCSARLTRYKQPTVIVFRDELPRTSLGKVLRRQLRDEMTQRVAVGSDA